MVKAAGAGAYVLDDDRIIHVPAAARPAVADSTGAGDTFCGGLAAGLARGLSVVESAALGAAVAAVAITGERQPAAAAPGHRPGGHRRDRTAAGRGGDRNRPVGPGGLPVGRHEDRPGSLKKPGQLRPEASSVPGRTGDMTST